MRAGSRVTTWNYDTYRGFLTGKVYDGSAQGPIYTYTDAGRLQTRLWARGITTTYSYNGFGDLSTVVYTNSVTPGMANGYDREGHVNIVSNGATVCRFTFNDAGLPLSESYSNGPLDGISISSVYDGFLRRTTNTTALNGTNLTMITNNFDAASRLYFISDQTDSATYSYLSNSPLVQQINLKQGSTTRMTTSKTYDYLNRLTAISSANASSVVLDSHNYGYNSANQRTAVTNTDNSKWNYSYDSLGQVTGGGKHLEQWKLCGRATVYV